jgi:hypothetical protein
MRNNEQKKDLKLSKQLEEEAMRQLLNEGISGQVGKKKGDSVKLAESLGLTTANAEVAEFLDGMSSDSDDSGDEEYDRTKYIAGPAETIEVYKEKTLEDIIDEQRAKLSALGLKGTPVTEATFKIWRDAKLLQRQADAEMRMKLEMMKKKGGKGLSVLSGKELFNYNSELFVDDVGAVTRAEEREMNTSSKLEEKQAEARAIYESEKAQAEQDRLMIVQRLEEAERQEKYAKRRIDSLKEDITIFLLGEIKIRELVFDLDKDEKEDLELFNDYEEEYQFVEEGGECKLVS